MWKQAWWGMATGLLGAFSLPACAHQEPLPVNAPVESLPATKSEEPVAPVPQASPSTNLKAEEEKATVPKTWLSREEVDAAREAERQHASDMQTFWAMRKDRESLRPTNIGPGGACVCFGGDPLCSCR